MKSIIGSGTDKPAVLKRDLGIAAATAIVVGNTIGSGIFMIPQSLAAASNPTASIIALLVTAIGSLLLAIIYARLGTALPETGGSVVYTRVALGEFPSFLSAWSYWISTWVANATIVTAFMSYLAFFCPIFTQNKLVAFIAAAFILWLLTFMNVIGVKKAGMIGIVTTVFKILPLLLFAIIAAMYFNPGNFNTVSGAGVAGMSTISVAVGITLWSFLGFESITFPAEEVKKPERTIKLSITLGFAIIALIYLAIIIFAIGAMSQDKLAVSNAPLADIINQVTGGSWGGTLIAIGALISTLGTTSGWILVSGRCSYAAAKNKIFPDVFGRVHPRFRTPHASLIIAGICATILLVMNYVNTLTAAFNFMLLLATLAALPVYSLTAISEMVILWKQPERFNVWNFIKGTFMSLLAFAYSIYAIYGTGAEVVMYGFILMLAGLPFYVYMKLKNKTA